MNFNPERLMVVFVIAMLVLGPKRLPEAARTAARWLHEVRRYTTNVRSEMRGLLDESFQEGAVIRDELRTALAEPRDALETSAREVRSWPSELSSDLSPELSPPTWDQGTATPVAVPDDPNLN